MHPIAAAPWGQTRAEWGKVVGGKSLPDWRARCIKTYQKLRWKSGSCEIKQRISPPFSAHQIGEDNPFCLDSKPPNHDLPRQHFAHWIPIWIFPPFFVSIGAPGTWIWNKPPGTISWFLSISMSWFLFPWNDGSWHDFSSLSGAVALGPAHPLFFLTFWREGSVIVALMTRQIAYAILCGWMDHHFHPLTRIPPSS